MSKVEQRLNDQIICGPIGKPDVYDIQTHENCGEGHDLWLTKSGLLLTKQEKQVWGEIDSESHKKILAMAKGIVDSSLNGRQVAKEELSNRIFREEMRIIRNWLYQENACGGCNSCS